MQKLLKWAGQRRKTYFAYSPNNQAYAKFLYTVMHFDYVKQIEELSREQHLEFYEHFAHNLTISVRGVWSYDELSDAEKVDRIRWINEIMHRITSKIYHLRLNKDTWSEQSMWEMIKYYVSQNPGIRGEIHQSIFASYNYVTRQSD